MNCRDKKPFWNPPLDPRPEKPKNTCEGCVWEFTYDKINYKELLTLLTNRERKLIEDEKYTPKEVFEAKIKRKRLR